MIYDTYIIYAYRYCILVRVPMDGERGPVKKFCAKFLQQKESTKNQREEMTIKSHIRENRL